MTARNVFGALAFVLPAAIIIIVLLPIVGADKEQIALIVVGNVLSWPVLVLQYFYGSSSGSKEKDALMAQRPTGQPDDPVFVEEDGK